MFARYMLPLCLFTLFLVVVCADEAIQQPNTVVDDAQHADPAARAVAKILGQIISGTTTNCLMEAANNCKSHLENLGNAIDCGKNFLKANKRRCAISTYKL